MKSREVAPKLLLYCVKAKPYLNDYRLMEHCNQFVTMNKPYNALNGKIVAECDFEVEWYDTYWDCMNFKENNGLVKSCLANKELFDYLKGKSEFYAIHIKNLHIFDEPKELCSFYQLDKKALKESEYEVNPITKAPQNMMYCEDGLETKIIISIRPEWLCKILNGEKTIEVRKKVLRGMLENEK